MAKRGENIYHRKDGRWEGRYVIGRTADGRTRFGYVYARQYREVKARLSVLKGDLLAGRAPTARFGDGTLNDWLDYWLRVRVQPEVRESTYQFYLRLARVHIRPALGGMQLMQLTEARIRAFTAQLHEALSPNTALGVLRLLKSALKFACYRDLIEKNPFEALRMPGGARKKPRVLSRAEQAALEGAAARCGRPEFLLMLYTGLRLGEACALKWADFDADAGTLRISATLQRLKRPEPAEGDLQFRTGRKTNLCLGAPKSDCSAREIPIPAFLCGLLKSWRAKSGAADGDFILRGRGGQAVDPRTVQARFAALTARLGIAGAHAHTLRHTYATRCLEKHIGYETLALLLGHASPRITMDYYAHATGETLRRSVSRLRPIAMQKP